MQSYFKLKYFSDKPKTLLSFRPARSFSTLQDFFQRLPKPLYYYIIGANLGIYLAWNTGILPKSFMYNHFTLSKINIDRHFYHTLVTSAFSHMGFMHFGMNMMTLYFFGKFVELYFGSYTLFQLYLAGALCSGLFVYLQDRKRPFVTHTIGASGAVSSILSFFIFNFPHEKIFLFFIPIPAWLLGTILFFQSMSFYERGQGVSHSGHFGGIMAGAAMFFYRKGKIF